MSRRRTPPDGPSTRGVFRNRALPYLLVLPQVTITLVFFVWPALESFWLSLNQVSAFGDRRIFIGVGNFVKLLRSEEYLQSVVSSGVLAIGVTIGGLAVSLGLAVLANQRIRGLRIYRAALLWPYGMAPAVAGIIWLFIFHPVYGLAPFAFTFGSLKLNWLANGWVAMTMITGAAIWKQLGYNVALFLAALQTVPRAVLEAADIDGAGAGDRFWRVVFPLLSPVTFFLAVTNVVFAFFDTFGLIHVVTQGGPGRATEILVYKAYRDGFVYQQSGISAAQSVILMTVVVALTVAQFRYAERWVAY